MKLVTRQAMRNEAGGALEVNSWSFQGRRTGHMEAAALSGVSCPRSSWESFLRKHSNEELLPPPPHTLKI